MSWGCFMDNGPILLFAGFDASQKAGLWVTNGTVAGTYELTPINGAYSYGVYGGVNIDNPEKWVSPSHTSVPLIALRDGKPAKASRRWD